MHLGLCIPSDVDLQFLVGGENASWTEGKVTVFDDSFEHEIIFPATAATQRRPIHPCQAAAFQHPLTPGPGTPLSRTPPSYALAHAPLICPRALLPQTHGDDSSCGISRSKAPQGGDKYRSLLMKLLE